MTGEAFDVWEARDVGTDWGPYSAYAREQLDGIETGWHVHARFGGWRVPDGAGR